MKRLAFIHNRFPAGGAERVTLDIARYLKSIGGYEVYVFVSHVTDFVDDSLNIIKVPPQSIPSRRSRYIESLVKELSIDVLVQISKSIYDIEGIRERTSCKVILACHGELFWQRYSIMHNRQKHKFLWNLLYKKKYADGTLAERIARERTMRDYKSCDVYVVLCEEYRLQMEKDLSIGADSHVVVIENSEQIVPSPCLEKENMMLFCGRFENWSKRIDRLLRIWKLVQDDIPGWELEMVGDGPAWEEMKVYAQRLALKRVKFEGCRSDVSAFYSRASVVCMTSQTEGWPLALTEGQANGCIGVAFACSAGVEDVLSPNGKCGFLVKPFDENAYATVLKKIASCREVDLRSIRINGINKRKQYSPEIISHKWKVLFDSLCKK